MRNFIKYGLITLAITAAIIVAINFIKIDYKALTNEDIETEMLQIQAKAKVEFEKYHVDKENGLKGEKIDNSEYGIDEEGSFYKWTKDTLDEVGQTQSILKEGEYYLINYDTEEVIYSAGVKLEDENVYYKLSEIEKYKKSKEEQEETGKKHEQEETGEKQEQEQEQGEEADEGEGNTKTE